MHISLSPQRRDDLLEITKDGDKLRINGELFSFMGLPDGATIPAGGVPCEWIIGPVERVDGDLRLTLILPHGPSPSPAVAYPEPIINPGDGRLDLPFDPVTDKQEDPDDVDG